MIMTTKDTPVTETFRALSEREIEFVSGGAYTHARVHVTGNSDAEALALIVPGAVVLSYAGASSSGFGSAWATATAAS